MWVNNNEAATWERLLDVVNQLKEKAIADKIHQEYLKPLEELKNNTESKVVGNRERS